MLDDFMMRATLAGVGVAIPAAVVGCFVVWRRMAYFGDATAHAAILGVALALGFDMSIFAGVLIVAAIMALSINGLASRGHTMDATLGVLAHAALAFGLVAVAMLPGAQVDLEAYLFGDILLVSKTDLLVIWGGGAVVVAVFAWRWQSVLMATLDPDLARAGGIDPNRERRFLTLTLAILVAVAIKVVGALLITALLIIPAATARPLARTPEVMVAGAVGIGVLSALIGLRGSLWADTPAGPMIVCVTAVLFGIVTIVARHRG